MKCIDCPFVMACWAKRIYRPLWVCKKCYRIWFRIPAAKGSLKHFVILTCELRNGDTLFYADIKVESQTRIITDSVDRTNDLLMNTCPACSFHSPEMVAQVFKEVFHDLDTPEGMETFRAL